MSALAINRESQDSVELVVGPGEIARLPFGIRGDNLALGNAADKKTFALRIPGNAFWNKLWIVKPEGDRRVRRPRFLVGQLLADGGKLRLVPDLIKSYSTRRNQPELTPFQAAQERERRLPLAKTETNYRLIEN